MISKKNNHPQQSEVWLFDPDPVQGNEIGKKVRPAVIVSCNSLNESPSGLIIVVPLTSRDKKIFSHVRIEPHEAGLDLPSFAVCEQIRSICKTRLIKKIGKINNSDKIKKIHEWLTDLLWIEE